MQGRYNVDFKASFVIESLLRADCNYDKDSTCGTLDPCEDWQSRVKLFVYSCDLLIEAVEVQRVLRSPPGLLPHTVLTRSNEGQRGPIYSKSYWLSCIVFPYATLLCSYPGL